MKPAQEKRDGRMAYNGLYLHYLGLNNVTNMATMAEQKLRDMVYNGEQRQWDFEKYVNVHKQQHSVMEVLVEHGYTGIDPRSKARHHAHRDDVAGVRSLTPSRAQSAFIIVNISYLTSCSKPILE